MAKSVLNNRHIVKMLEKYLKVCVEYKGWEKLSKWRMNLGVWDCIQSTVFSFAEPSEELRDLGGYQAWKSHNHRFPEILFAQELRDVGLLD